MLDIPGLSLRFDDSLSVPIPSSLIGLMNVSEENKLSKYINWSMQSMFGARERFLYLQHF